MLRSGLLAKKLGMTQVYDDAGNHIPVTVLSLEGIARFNGPVSGSG